MLTILVFVAVALALGASTARGAASTATGSTTVAADSSIAAGKAAALPVARAACANKKKATKARIVVTAGDTSVTYSFKCSAVAKSMATTTTTTTTTAPPPPPTMGNGAAVLPGYPKLVPISAIDSRVANWFQLHPLPSDQAVEIAPGLFAPYNPVVPNLASYLSGPVTGDCAVMHEYFPHSGGTCWDGVAAT